MNTLFAGSLLHGFAISNFIGQLIVYVQVLCSIVGLAIVIGKLKQLAFLRSATNRFTHDFTSSGDVMDAYLSRRPRPDAGGVVGVYASTCERLLRILSPDSRSVLAGRPEGAQAAALTAREIELVRGTCEQALDEEEIRLDAKMGALAAIVALAPMLGLLGTVWGVLDAFYEMGTAGSANLATIAPSISAALVTTVVGLLVAIPGTALFTWIQGLIRKLRTDMEGFCDELMGRIACEFQGRSA